MQISVFKWQWTWAISAAAAANIWPLFAGAGEWMESMCVWHDNGNNIRIFNTWMCCCYCDLISQILNSEHLVCFTGAHMRPRKKRRCTLSIACHWWTTDGPEKRASIQRGRDRVRASAIIIISSTRVPPGRTDGRWRRASAEEQQQRWRRQQTTGRSFFLFFAIIIQKAFTRYIFVHAMYRIWF